MLKRTLHAAGLGPAALAASGWIARIWFAGRAFHCPICRANLRGFRPHRNRLGAKCPVCRSLERHRLLWLYLRERTDLFDGRPKSLLHIAPEPCFLGALTRTPNLDYTSGDLDSPWARRRLDLTHLDLPDDAFDVVLCSHVLEHVPDDRRAMAELYRVMKPGGWGVIQVPIHREETFEDPSITLPRDRLRVFGQEDHVRVYGKDYVDRLRAAGFHVELDSFARTIDQEQVRRLGLMPTEDIHLCNKVQPAR